MGVTDAEPIEKIRLPGREVVRRLRDRLRRRPPSDQDLLAAMVVILLAGLALPEIGRRLTLLLAPLGIPPAAIVSLLTIVGEEGTQMAVPPPAPDAPAIGTMQRSAVGRRAMYLLAASRRLAAGGSTAAERALYGAHLAAEERRHEAAARVDAAAKRWGPVLGWWSERDDRTTALCRAAHGTNFSALAPPAGVGWPGTIHAGQCRCKPVAPWSQAQMLGSDWPANRELLLAPLEV